MKKNSLKAAAKTMAANASSIVIQQPTILSISLEVEGTADLIQNRFSQKAVEEMLRKHMGISVQREKKKPREVLEDATIYNTDRRVCVPPTAFKLAMIAAAGQLKGLKKTELKTALFVVGNSVPITYREMLPRMDMTRLSGIGRTPDVRFRPSFQDWKARLTIQFGDTLSVETVVDLLNRAGRVGVGEWRPQRNGSHGTFKVSRHIDDPKEIGEIEAECSVSLVPLRIPTWALDLDIDPAILSEMFDEANTEQREPIAS